MNGRIIAVTGKGGTGKTAIAGLLVLHYSEEAPILAVDADPDSNLPEVLGEKVGRTVGDMREYLHSASLPPDTNKESLLESKIYEVITETPRFDLLVMGRPEGSGCYCFANNLLRGIMKRLVKNYPLTILDTAAGLEHISRGLLADIDTLLIVTDTSKRGLHTAQRIKQLTTELGIKIKNTYLIANKIQDNARINLDNTACGLELLGAIPYDPILADLDARGEPLTELPENSPALKEVRKIAEALL